MDLNTLASRRTACLSDEEKHQNGTQEYQSDLEVILEFLEEHYKQESGGKSFWSDAKDLCSTSDAADASEAKLPTEEHFGHVTERLSAPVALRANANNSYSDLATTNQALDLRNESDGPVFIAPQASERQLTQNTTPENATKPLAGFTPAEKGKKLRLFHFLFEVLEDPKMADCVSWVPASVGVFRFSARHKERVAELWGQRKGNRMPMTYQKMSRALRNYVRSGEIIKVKKKLTYQFSVATLITLKSQHGMKNDPFVSK